MDYLGLARSGIMNAVGDPDGPPLAVQGANAGILIADLDEIFATKPSAEWVEQPDAAGDFIFSLVNSVSDLPDDPQRRANDLIAHEPHPSLGDLEMLNIPLGLAGRPAEIRGTAPEYGQHTEEILLEELGYDWDQVGALREAEVI